MPEPTDKSISSKFRDIIIPLAALLPSAIGVWFTYNYNIESEKNRLTTARADLMKHREQVEINFKSDALPVAAKILNDSTSGVQRRFEMFKLFMHNFHDMFNGRVIFESLTREAEMLREPEREKMLTDIDNFGREISEREAYEVGVANEIVKLKLYDSICVYFPERDSSGALSNNDMKIVLTLLGRDKHYARVRMQILSLADTSRTIDRKFHVRFYDSPLTDNILLPNDQCLSVTLLDVSFESQPIVATLNIIKFHTEFIPSGFRRSIKDVDAILKGAIK